MKWQISQAKGPLFHSSQTKLSHTTICYKGVEPKSLAMGSFCGHPRQAEAHLHPAVCMFRGEANTHPYHA